MSMMRGLAVRAVVVAALAAANTLAATSVLGEGTAPVDVAARKRSKPRGLPRCQGAPQCLPSFIARLKNAPFPIRANDDGQGRPFFNDIKRSSGKRFRITKDGKRYPEAFHYSDPSVLFHVPRSFDRDKPFRVVVYFHGDESVLEPDVVGDSGLIEQIDASHTNVILIAPQLAYAAIDSHPGKLIRPGGLARMLDEASGILARALGRRFGRRMARAPVVLVAFSGGYLPLAKALSTSDGGSRLVERIEGIVLLDAIYGELPLIDGWLEARSGRVFLVGLYGRQSRRRTLDLFSRWDDRRMTYKQRLPRRIQRGTVSLARVRTDHPAIVNDGPPRDPIAAILRRLPPP
ncbi:MAG TPA: hypothetical protein VM325_02175 [Alphaproteobacteria bacterium]|nr:hypothetical protein [Alphaproteobacteria bacterium]